VDHRDLHSFPTRRSSDLGGEEVHRRLLRATTKRTMSNSQSRSVDSTRWAAPVPWTRRACSAWRAAAASAKRARTAGLDVWTSTRSEEHTSELQSPYDLVC